MKITEYSFKSPVKRDLCAAFVSDTHDCPFERIVREIENKRADLILLTGDIIYQHTDNAERGFRMLPAFAATAPTFMSLGNHEGNAVKIVRSICFECGVTLLENRSVKFEGLKIGGLTSGWIIDDEGINRSHHGYTPEPNLEWLNSFAAEDGYKVLLNHHPEYYPRYIKDLNIDLTVSGHAHGGQWRIFNRGIYAPGQGLFPKYTSGLYDDRLIVSRGLANNAFVPRIFNSTELIFIHFNNDN